MSLVEHGVAVLRDRWDPMTQPGHVYVDLSERAVFEATVGGRALVVKVDTADPRFRREELLLGAAGAAGLPVPAVAFGDPGPPSILGLEAVRGVTLATVRGHRAWEAAGRELRRIHELEPPVGLPAFGTPQPVWREFVLDWTDRERRLALDRGAPARAATERLCAWVIEVFSGLGVTDDRVLHGDCQPSHVVLDPDATAVTGWLDFGDAGLGDPCWDIAVLTLWHEDRLPPLLRGYGREFGGQARLDELLLAYRVLRHLAATGWLIEHGFDPTAHVRRLERLADRVLAAGAMTATSASPDIPAASALRLEALVASTYGRLRHTYDAWSAHVDPPLREAWLEKLTARVPDGGTVLELGCDTGRPAGELLNSRYGYTGVDLSAEMALLAREALPGADIRCADMALVDFPAESFDGVVAFYSVIHVPRQRQAALVGRIASWLRPEGVAVLNLAVSDEEASIEEDWIGGGPMYWSSYDADTNLTMVDDAGLEVLEAERHRQDEGCGGTVEFQWILARRPPPDQPSVDVSAVREAGW